MSVLRAMCNSFDNIHVLHVSVRTLDEIDATDFMVILFRLSHEAFLPRI